MPVVSRRRVAAWGITFRPMHALSRGKARVPAASLPPGLPDGAVPALRSTG